MRRCPACNLPTRPNAAGLTFSASSNDNRTHGVICLCMRCTAAGSRLPRSAQFKTAARAADRALANPGHYLCCTFPNPDTARLAAAMLTHPQHVLATLEAIGWGDDAGHAT
jgi:hypothetical protein